MYYLISVLRNGVIVLHADPMYYVLQNNVINIYAEIEIYLQLIPMFCQVTLADLRAFDIFSNLRVRQPGIAGVAPLLNAHCDRVGALPRIKAWVEKQPAISK